MSSDLWKKSWEAGLAFQRLQLAYLKWFYPNEWVEAKRISNEEYAERLMNLGVKKPVNLDERR
jgi:hypothetical protein